MLDTTAECPEIKKNFLGIALDEIGFCLVGSGTDGLMTDDLA